MYVTLEFKFAHFLQVVHAESLRDAHMTARMTVPTRNSKMTSLDRGIKLQPEPRSLLRLGVGTPSSSYLPKKSANTPLHLAVPLASPLSPKQDSTT